LSLVSETFQDGVSFVGQPQRTPARAPRRDRRTRSNDAKRRSLCFASVLCLSGSAIFAAALTIPDLREARAAFRVSLFVPDGNGENREILGYAVLRPR